MTNIIESSSKKQYTKEKFKPQHTHMKANANAVNYHRDVLFCFSQVTQGNVKEI